MSTLRSNPGRRAMRGVSLIEVMIALLVLSVGMLGMIGLRASGLRHVTLANSRAVAAIHSADILDRLRANPVRAVAGQYELALDDPAPADPATIVEVDLAQWRSRITETLPQGTGSVLVLADGTARVQVRWVEPAQREPNQGGPVTFSFEARL